MAEENKYFKIFKEIDEYLAGAPQKSELRTRYYIRFLYWCCVELSKALSDIHKIVRGVR